MESNRQIKLDEHQMQIFQAMLEGVSHPKIAETMRSTLSIVFRRGDAIFRQLGVNGKPIVVKFDALRKARLITSEQFPEKPMEYIFNPTWSLSPAQQSCLMLTSEGMTTREIATSTKTSQSTITTLLSSAYKRMGVRPGIPAISELRIYSHANAPRVSLNVEDCRSCAVETSSRPSNIPTTRDTLVAEAPHEMRLVRNLTDEQLPETKLRNSVSHARKGKHNGIKAGTAYQIKMLEEENAVLQRIVAKLALELRAAGTYV